eukprot:133180-Pleurochrysis_carterae.AAC.1
MLLHKRARNSCATLVPNREYMILRDSSGHVERGRGRCMGSHFGGILSPSLATSRALEYAHSHLDRVAARGWKQAWMSCAHPRKRAQWRTRDGACAGSCASV